jgi:cell division protein FtsL
MASWPSAVAYTEPAPVERRRRVARRRDPLRSGVLWIVVVGALLAGLVAVNVAVLQLNARLDQLAQERAKLRDENTSLESQLSTAAVLARIQGRARQRLGLVPATSVTYVNVARR